MFCIKCGTENDSSKVVCSGCGAKLAERSVTEEESQLISFAADDLRGASSISAAVAAFFALLFIPSGERLIYVLICAAVALVCGMLCLNTNFRFSAILGILLTTICLACTLGFGGLIGF